MPLMGPVTRYRTLPRGGGASEEIVEKRSRFLARVTRVDSAQAARDLVERARTAHPDARHHCSAFVIGPDGVTHGAHDDGEPAGTAGAPILDVLLGSGLRDVGAVVTRWFGGTLLGAGGLVRAYAAATTAALGTAPVLERELRQVWTLTLPHALAGQVEHALRTAGVRVDGHDWSRPAGVGLTLAVPPGEGGRTEALLAQATSGTVSARVLGEEWVDLEPGSG